MELTAKQMEGLNIAIARYRADEKYTCISGYAGSGKSTLVKFIVSALQIPEDDIVYACFTGKACNVLQQKGNKNVSTLHRLLYEFRPRSNGTFYRIPKTELEYRIVIVDEVSMASKELMDQLFRHNVYVICLGDPFQLPPINPNDDHHLLDHPHVFLDEIYRQAQESEIIRVSMDIRAGRPLERFDGNDVKIINNNELVDGMYLWADQILCAKNDTRIGINNYVRNMLGREGEPQEGDKVICLRNYWDVLDSEDNPLINGTIGYLKNNHTELRRYPFYINGGGAFEVINTGIITETNSCFTNLNLDKKLILEGVKALDPKTEWRLMKDDRLAWIVPMEFTYGYAITTHKSQGSQFGKILVIEENFPFSKEEHARWLYTAVTRAIDKAVIVRK
jgi:exodeoxyribonuclease-5